MFYPSLPHLFFLPPFPKKWILGILRLWSISFHLPFLSSISYKLNQTIFLLWSISSHLPCLSSISNIINQTILHLGSISTLSLLPHYQLLAPPGASSMTALVMDGTMYQSPSRDMFWQYLNHFWSAFSKNRFFWGLLFMAVAPCKANLHIILSFLHISVKNCSNIKKLGTI